MEPSYEEPVAEVGSGGGSAGAEAGGGAAGGGGQSQYEQLIPGVLRDRSAAALAKWKANH
jgi:hypothetical protein